MLGCEGISGTQNRMPGGLGLKNKEGGWLFTEAWYSWEKLLDAVLAEGGEPEYLKILSEDGKGEKIIEEFAKRIVEAAREREVDECFGMPQRSWTRHLRNFKSRNRISRIFRGYWSRATRLCGILRNK